MNEWWIHPGRIRSTANPTDKDLERHREEGFAVLISLLDEGCENYDVSRAKEAGWERHVIAIPECGAPSLEQLEEFAGIIRATPLVEKVLMHCSTGTGRAATMGAAYWISQGRSPAWAIARIDADHSGWHTCERKAVLDQFATVRGQATDLDPDTRST